MFGGVVEGVIDALATEEQAITRLHVHGVIETSLKQIPAVRQFWSKAPKFQNNFD